MPPLDLTDAEHLKRVVVEPLIAALRSEMRESLRPLVDELARLRQDGIAQGQRIEAMERRLGGIERLKMRIVAICSGIALLAGFVWRILSAWIGGYFLNGH